ncbi:MAG: WG repeat-containing protein [Chlorobi bacterium]|nr:WG repeat-containing protein [Chlorobiota bacterium]
MKKLTALIAILLAFGAFQTQASKTLYPFVNQDKVGFIDSSGKIVIPATYETDVSTEIALKDNDNIPSFDNLDDLRFQEGRVMIPIIKKSKFFGIFNITQDEYNIVVADDGTTVSNLGIEEVGEFKNGLAPAKMPRLTYNYENDCNYGFVDVDMKMVIEPEYAYAAEFSDGMALVMRDDLYGYINNKGETLIEHKYRDANNFSDGLASVLIGYKLGYINKAGDQVIDAKFDVAGQFKHGTAKVFINGGYRFIDKKGNYINSEVYESASDFCCGLASVMKNGKYGYIDPSGKTVIPMQYVDAGSFGCGLAKVKQDGKWGYINRSGEFVISPRYDFCRDFNCNMAIVWDQGDVKYIDNSGKDIFTFHSYETEEI